MAVQLTLKRADAIAKAALKAANDAKLETTINLSIYSPTMAFGLDALVGVVIQAKDKLLQVHQVSGDLIAANFALRALLADQNAQCGVSVRLNRLNQLKAEETHLRKLLSLCENEDGEKDVQTAMAKAKAMRETPRSERRGYIGTVDDTVRLSLVGDTDIEAWRKQLRVIVDNKRQINDEITALNVSNHVALDDTTAATLREADLLS